MDVFLKWDPDTLSLSVPAMDSEHQTLIAIMNELYEQHGAGAQREVLSATLEKLASYTVEHFAHEEAFMESIGFPGLDTHKLIHKDLLEQLAAHREGFEKGDGTLPDELFHFLKLWLTAHIRGIDTKYALHAKQPTA